MKICYNYIVVMSYYQTERARHLLQVREKVRERERILQGHSQQELTLSDETKEELAKKVLCYMQNDHCVVIIYRSV